MSFRNGHIRFTLLIFLISGSAAIAGDGPGGLQLDIGASVPTSDVAIIENGIKNAQDLLAEKLGGDVPGTIRLDSVVNIVATGNGDPDGGDCCTSDRLSDSGNFQIFFDVLHPDWLNAGDFSGAVDRRLQIAAHEYAHGWDIALGCLDIPGQPPFWLNEGTAEYIAYSSLIEKGQLTLRKATSFAFDVARSSGELDVPLQDLTDGSLNIWPGDVGYLAVLNLVFNAPSGPLSLREFCESVTAGQSISSAFQASFGIGLSEFYREFEPSPVPPGFPKAMPWLGLLLLDD